MPDLLSRNAIRMLESSVSALAMACTGLGSDKGRPSRSTSAENAVELGLLGVAAELAMGACLTQAHGSRALSKQGSLLRTSAEIRSHFLRLLKDRAPNSGFLFSKVEDPEKHREDLVVRTQSLAVLSPLRAVALHTGQGLIHEAVVAKANEISEFLEALSKSRRIKPYLSWIPRCRLYVRDRVLLVEDLARRLKEKQQDLQTLSSLFLVLPEVPADEPEWLASLDRVMVAPKKNDLDYLLRVASDACPVVLRRSGSGGSQLSVVVRPSDPSAIPIAPHFLRGSFISQKDQWYADRANANGRLEEGVLDLPPREAVLGVFGTGLHDAGILEKGQQFNGHDAWPFVASSLSVQGEPGPHWFIVRETSDLGQLVAQLKRAAPLGSTWLRTRVQELYIGIESIQKSRPAERSAPFSIDYRERRQFARLTRMKLESCRRRHRTGERAIPEEFVSLLHQIAESAQGVGQLLMDIISSGMSLVGKVYWCRMLAACAHDMDDAQAIVSMVSDPDLAATHSEAKKAIRWLDIRTYGPPMGDDL